MGDQKEKKPLQKPGEYVPTPYAPPTPTATYDGSDQAALFQQMIADYVNRTDPQKQAEQDRQIQRGREIWTGANLFTNVIANAINAYGTAKGAPSMTFNDAATQKMYTDWQTADRELKADRKAAQQRLDALRLQDAQFRMADKQAADKAAAETARINWQAQNEAAKINSGREWDEYKTQQTQEYQDKVRKENHENQLELQDRYDRRARIKGSGGGSTPDNSKYSVWAGGIEIPAKNVGEHKSKAGKIVKMMVDAINKDRTDNPFELAKDPSKAKIKADDIKNWDDWIALNFEELYNSDADFAKAFNEAFQNKETPHVKPEGQFTRRKGSPMMTDPDASEERMTELDNWFKNGR